MNSTLSTALLAALRLLTALTLLGSAALAQAEVRLLTSIKPLQLIAAAVEDGVSQPDVLLPAGASPHEFTLRPSDMRRLGQADLFYWIGPNMEGFLSKPLASRQGITVTVQQLPGLHLRYFAKAQPGDDDDNDHDPDHQPDGLDGHLWLDTYNAGVIAEHIASDLGRLDPQHQQRYQANVQAFKQRLSQLDQQLDQRLTKVADKPYFVFHDSYGYFEQTHHLHPAGVLAIEHGAQPGARHLARMCERLKQAGRVCLFNEPPARPALATTISEGLPVTLAELDGQGLQAPVNANGYETMLSHLTDQLVGCLAKY